MTNRLVGGEDGPHVLWRVKGAHRVIAATLRRRPWAGFELVVGFEDNPVEIIETQLEPVEVEALVARADAVKRALLKRGLVEIQSDDPHPGLWTQERASA